MEDKNIIELFFKRSENAILETDKKYGKYCRKISYNILFDFNDAEECTNDTYLKLWENIPPNRPNYFLSYISKIIRNISLNLYDKKNTGKRGKGEVPILLDELSECIPSNVYTENEFIKNEDLKMLTKYLNEFLYTLNDKKRIIFIRRYFFAESIKDISYKTGIGENSIKSILFRQRKALKKYLEKEGVIV